MVDVLLRRDLEDTRRREEAYRVRVERGAALSRRLQAHTAALRELLEGDVSPATAEQTLTAIAALSAKALSVSRTSIWLFDDARETLVCRVEIVDGERRSSPSLSLPVAQCPGYVAAITHGAIVAVEDVATDPRMAGLGEYLRARNVGALLDLAIAVPGGTSGVVCHEHLGGPRRWEQEEIDFGSAVAGMVALALEAQRRILAERKAAGLDAKYRHLVESLPVVPYSFDVCSGELEYLSPRIADLGGWSPATWAGAEGGSVRSWLRHVVPEDRARVEERFRADASRALTPEIVYRVRGPDGRVRWIRDTCAVVRGHTGDPIAIQGILTDITGWREAQLASEENERRFLSLLESVDLLGVIVGTDGRIELANDAVVALTGRPREQLIGASSFDVLRPELDEAARAKARAAIANRTAPRRREVDFPAPSGVRRIVWTDGILNDQAGAPCGVASIGVDVTERVLHERRVLEREKEESLGRLAAGVAHDFNNMLTVMSAGLESIEEESPSAAQAISQMRAALTQAADLTKALLNYARREPLAKVGVDVDAVIRDLGPILTHLTSGLDLTQDPHAGGAVVELAPTHLRQVVINLVANAADATRGVGAQVRLTTARRNIDADEARRRGLGAERSYVTITVSDDGVGIEREVLARLFEPFFTTKSEGRGTGIGLATVQRIVTSAGGYVDVESTPGRGATFQVSLPEVSIAPTGPLPRVDAVLRPDVVPSVLVVEDYAAIRRLAVRMLTEAGFEVAAAADLREAYDTFDRRAFDLLLVDEHLPDGSGRSFASQARSRHPSMKTVLFSGGSDDSAEFDASVLKPFTRESLLSTIDLVLGRA
jgi:PAS domain S-box-containing protein